MMTSSVWVAGALLFDLPQKLRIPFPVNPRRTVSVRE
jgi:hypothetical protein